MARHKMKTECSEEARTALYVATTALLPCSRCPEVRRIADGEKEVPVVRVAPADTRPQRRYPTSMSRRIWQRRLEVEIDTVSLDDFKPKR